MGRPAATSQSRARCEWRAVGDDNHELFDLLDAWCAHRQCSRAELLGVLVAAVQPRDPALLARWETWKAHNR